MHPTLFARAATAQHAAVLAHYFARDDFTAYLQPIHRQNYIAVFHEADAVVMKLTKEFLSLFRVASAAVYLVLPKGGKHIREHHPLDAQEILAGISHALMRIKYVSKRRNKHGKLERGVVGEHRPDGLLFVAVKFVPARRAPSGKDEAWVPTSHIIKGKEVRRLLLKRRLRPLISGAA